MYSNSCSIAAGIVTPVLFAVLTRVCAGAPGAWGPNTPMQLFYSGIFLLSGMSMLPGINPRRYLVAAVLSAPAGLLLPAVPDMARDPSALNLIGLVLIGAFSASALAGGAAMVLNLISRRWHLPAWAAALPLGLCLVFMGGAKDSRRSTQFAEAVMQRMKQIHQAELEYASRSAGHTFTCDGLGLPHVGSLSWPRDPGMPSSVKSLALDSNYWFQMSCDGGSFELSAFPAWGNGTGGPHYFTNQDGKISMVRAAAP